MNEINVQPSTWQGPVMAPIAGKQYGGIPSPGIALTNPFTPAVLGVAGCRDLLADSPPTLFQQYGIYNFSIAVAVEQQNAPAAPTIALTLQLLVNDRVAASYTQSVNAIVEAAGGSNYCAQTMFVDDLNNPIRVGGRDRLGLKLLMVSNQTSPSGQPYLFAAAGAEPGGVAGVTYTPIESKLFYETIDLPASRRL